MGDRLSPQTVEFLKAGHVRVAEAPGWLVLLWFMQPYQWFPAGGVYLEREATGWANRVLGKE